MNAKFRYLYIICGLLGLAGLIYLLIDSYPDINPIYVLAVSVPDMIFFFLAYKTYPVVEVPQVQPVRRARVN